MTLKPTAGGASELAWTKSSYSGSSDNDCVEVAWTKSTYSAGNNNDCVEVAASSGDILVRDSKDPEGPHLALTPTAWTAFLTFARTADV